MRFYKKILFAVFFLVLFGLSAGVAEASCYCYSSDFSVSRSLPGTDALDCQQVGAAYNMICVLNEQSSAALDAASPSGGTDSAVSIINQTAQSGPSTPPVSADSTKNAPVAKSAILPDCLQNGNEFSDACESINTFVELALNIGAFAFSIIGALALAALIYGGFMLVISGGNSERVSKGWGAIFAAAIGLGITFGAYILIRFIINAIGANADWSLIP